MKVLKSILAALCLCAGAATLTSCTEKIEVQQVYDFALQTMPVQSEIKVGETAEIRCRLLKNGYYDDARFTIRYFQPDGDGELRMDDGTVFKPNDTYPLTAEVFRLYYTSHSTDQQTIDVYIESNMGQVEKSTFSFTNENTDDGTE
ncbi:MAG: DUF3872 domain-containing protein [Rikenellaceae bacterium]